MGIYLKAVAFCRDGAALELGARDDRNAFQKKGSGHQLRHFGRAV
jgi:hypothetical protein